MQLKTRLRNVEDILVSRLDKFTGYSLEKRRFQRAHGYPLNLDNPTSFNEKICWKKIHDRNPLLKELADKYRMREYVKSILGEEAGEELLIPMLHVTDRPESIPFDELPTSFVIKSNHGSGNNWLVPDKAKLDRAAVIRECRRWMAMAYGWRAHERAYRGTERKILIEPMLTDEQGHVPADYKLNLIHGKCQFIQVDQDRQTQITRTIYDPDWNRLPFSWKRPPGDDVPRPRRLDEMVALAEQLAGDLDYVRVDFYHTPEKLYLGELTNYPARGRGAIRPAEFDFKLGKAWRVQSA
ncbi:ATP-grasp fold amidoligase family protein [Saccharospirillum salsuginis]|uniref:TupA-like ATPgrasp n=1 Tax=Saccharospirillum salsuginis TaxID=418750 RepID=A0A918KIF2_9GAMM|nr:ATP-grasp fold amidoligase family protein [Saccharospirillum salsuginis]GGX64662.1 hypothetical protein GCM10007392_35600 [Saccharospirillum salsuginis]